MRVHEATGDERADERPDTSAQRPDKCPNAVADQRPDKCPDTAADAIAQRPVKRPDAAADTIAHRRPNKLRRRP